MKCRHCNSNLSLQFLDLGSSPPSNAYLKSESLNAPEKWFPLRVLVCENCWLVQTQDFSMASELFDSEYAYFSGFSKSWLEHSKAFVDFVVQRFHLNQASQVVEVAANDGYLLQYVKAKGISCTGVEPTASTANAAKEKGIEIVEKFFGVSLAKELVSAGKAADLTVANNVLAHVPDINDFVSGFSILLKSNGVATFEFPHLLQLVNGIQFDTIYHEHFSYLSLTAVKKIFENNGLSIFDVEELSTHGGSLRVYAQKLDTGIHSVSKRVNEILDNEEKQGVSSRNFYEGFQKKSESIKDGLLLFLLRAKAESKKVIGYGAAAKGNTLLNFSGIRSDLISFVVDKNPAKQNKYLPGSRIPIFTPDKIKASKPDYVLILPWNIKKEVMEEMKYINEWGGRFVTAIPKLEIY